MGEANTHYKVRQYVQRKFIDVGSTAPGFTPTGDTFCSDYIYLRTGEMYFVAAEALYRAGKESEAKTMLTTIMKTRNPNMKHPQQVMHFYKKLNFKSVLKCGVKVVVYLI